MQHPFFYLPGSSLRPEGTSDITTSTPSYIHLSLVTIATLRAFPQEFAILLHNLYLAIKTTDLAVIRFCIQFSVHDVIVDKLDDRQHRWDIIL